MCNVVTNSRALPPGGRDRKRTTYRVSSDSRPGDLGPRSLSDLRLRGYESPRSTVLAPVCEVRTVSSSSTRCRQACASRAGNPRFPMQLRAPAAPSLRKTASGCRRGQQSSRMPTLASTTSTAETTATSNQARAPLSLQGERCPERARCCATLFVAGSHFWGLGVQPSKRQETEVSQQPGTQAEKEAAALVLCTESEHPWQPCRVLQVRFQLVCT